MNKIYELKPREDIKGKNPWDPWYDKCFGFTVVAANEQEARELANDEAGDEGEVWTNPEYVTCKEVDISVARIVTEDFRSA